MGLIFYKFLAALLIFITSLVTLIYPIRARARPRHNPTFELADAFASGIFLGVALFHMLPSAIVGFSEIYPHLQYPLAELFCAGGFLTLLFLERLAQYRAHGHPTSTTMPHTFAIILIIHALIEGMVLGINTTFATAFVIFFAIIIHKGSESFALAIILDRSQMKLKRIIFIVGLFALMTPLGIAMGELLATQLQSKSGLMLASGFNAFAAGSFLYISTLHHINHHQRSHNAENMWEFTCLLLGLIIMASVAWV